MSKPHQATAPSSAGSRERTRSSAVRTPRAAVAEASRQPQGEPRDPARAGVQRPTSRSTSPGSSEIPRNSAITTAPKIAGTIVIANGAAPGITPRYRPTPSTTSVTMYTP